MATRSVRLDDEAEGALREIMDRTGLSISEAIKRGLIEYRQVAVGAEPRRPSDFFREFDLGEGGYAIGPARRSGELVKRRLSGRRTKRG